MPEVSILLPVYNGEEYLASALDSIAHQTFKDYELLVLDDGSQDRSVEIASQYANRDPRIRIINHPHLGLSQVLNKGLQAASARWVARMDADDIAHPSRLELQVEFMKAHTDIAVVGTSAWLVGPSGKIMGMSKLGPTNEEEFRLLRSKFKINFIHPTVMFDRQVVIAAGGYSTEYPACEDYELWNRLAKNHLLLSMAQPLLYYRIHDASTGTTAMRIQTESWARVRHNMEREQARLPPLSAVEFGIVRRQHPLAKRIERELVLRSRYSYRQAGAHLADGRMIGALWLLASFVFFPPVPLTRLYKQVVKPRSVRIARGCLDGLKRQSIVRKTADKTRIEP